MGLRPETRRYLAGLLLLTAGLLALALATAPTVTARDPALALGVAAAMAVAWRFPIQIGPHTNFHLTPCAGFWSGPRGGRTMGGA